MIGKIRILFLPPVDAEITNAQSLNTREIALRLDPNRFDITLWHTQKPDVRLQNRSNIRLKRLATRARTPQVFKELISRYDIVAYADYTPATFLFVHLPRFLRRRTRLVLHGEAPIAQMARPSRAFRFLWRGVISHCDVYTGITPYVADDIARVAQTEVKYILPVGVNLRCFSPPEHRLAPSPNVLFVGTLIERKGPQHILDAAKKFPAANFRLVGKGREGYEEVLRRRIQEMGLTNVVLEGPKSQTEIADIMRHSDIFLLPSRLEGLPKVTLEAAATGLPCIVFDDYETPSVVDGITGFQVSTLHQMLDRLGQLIRDRDLRGAMGAAARKHAEKFDWDIVCQQWEEAYLRIVNGVRR